VKELDFELSSEGQIRGSRVPFLLRSESSLSTAGAWTLVLVLPLLLPLPLECDAVWCSRERNKKSKPSEVTVSHKCGVHYVSFVVCKEPTSKLLDKFFTTPCVDVCRVLVPHSQVYQG
jgi:hypothetical protein